MKNMFRFDTLPLVPMETFDLWAQKVNCVCIGYWSLSTLCQSNFQGNFDFSGKGIISTLFLQCIDKFSLHGWQETRMVRSITGLVVLNRSSKTTIAS